MSERLGHPRLTWSRCLLPIVRRILLAFFVLTLTPPAFAAGPTLLFDPLNEEVISQDHAGDPWYPASITKLMTAYIIFQKLRSGDLKPDQKLTVSELAHAQPPSKIGVPAGQAVSVDFALQALLVYSANDMAYVLAEGADGSIPAFAAEMNAQAHKLGMTGSHFVNPNGLFDHRHVTTARDIAILASKILREFPEYDHYFSQPYLAIGKRHLANRNSLLRQMKEADGMKTGFVCSSGFNLVATATLDGRRLAAVIFGANSGKHRVDLAEMLLTDGFSRPTTAHAKLQSIPNVQTGSIVPTDMSAQVCKQKPVTLALSKSLGGWGISFGNYENSVTADMALRGRMLSPSGMDLPGTPGIIRMPEDRGFAAAMWNLDQATSEAACMRYHAEKAPCEVIPPEIFARIAALVPDPPPPPVMADPEDDDAAKPAPAKKKKKKT